MSEVEHLEFCIDGPRDLPIRGDVRLSKNTSEPRPCIIVCHGFKGFKDWGFYHYISECFARAGFCAITFNFSHNGIGENPLEFTDLDSFRKNTFSLEVEDLKCLHAALVEGSLPKAETMDADSIGLLGHSRGGYTVIVGGNELPVKARAVIASICRFPEVAPEIESEWREKGERLVENRRTMQMMPVGVPLLEELLSSRGKIEEEARKIESPFFIGHGTEDPTVPIEAAEALASWIPHAELLKVKGGDHVFGAVHPFAGTTPELEQVVSQLIAFYKENL